MVAGNSRIYPSMDRILVFTNEDQLSRWMGPDRSDWITNLITDLCSDKLEATRFLAFRIRTGFEFLGHCIEWRNDANQPRSC